MIRKAKQKDTNKIIKMMKDLYTKWDNIDEIDRIDDKWFNSKKAVKYVNEILKEKDFEILVKINSENKIIGYIMIKLIERKPFLKKVGEISEAYIKKENRNQGYGKQLFDEALKWFSEKEIEWITVSTHVKDIEANDFWKKRGFEEFNLDYKMKLLRTKMG